MEIGDRVRIIGRDHPWRRKVGAIVGYDDFGYRVSLDNDAEIGCAIECYAQRTELCYVGSRRTAGL